MGKATRWLRGLLGMKKDKENSDKKVKKRWSFGRLSNDSGAAVAQAPGEFPGDITVVGDSPWLMRSYMSDSEEQNKHAIAVAAATAAAADAAMAAAQAAAAVVKLTDQGKGGLLYGRREKWAAVKIQTFFRGYLARKALRALKGIVKLQALVRGYLVRKRAVATLYSMQALIRAQAAVRSQRARLSMSNDPRFVTDTRARKSIERFDSGLQSRRISGPYDQLINGTDESPKTVEIDTYRLKSKSSWRISTGMSDSGDDQNSHSQPMSTPPPCQIPGRLSIPDRRHLCESDWSFLGDHCKFPTAHNTPRTRGSGRFNAPPTPAKSVCGDSLFRPYSNCPSYMANTQSFNAKLRSQSEPKQRPEPGPKKRLSLKEIMASRSNFSGVRMHKSRYQVDQ